MIFLKPKHSNTTNISLDCQKQCQMMSCWDNSRLQYIISKPHIFSQTYIQRVYVTGSENMDYKIATLWALELVTHFSTSHTHILYDFELATPPCSNKAKLDHFLERKKFFL